MIAKIKYAIAFNFALMANQFGGCLYSCGKRVCSKTASILRSEKMNAMANSAGWCKTTTKD